MDVSKKMAVAIAAMYFLKDVEDIKSKAILAAVAIAGIICQTVIDAIKLRKTS
jgi:hypothetical protein